MPKEEHSQQNKNVLIICYSFPPHPGIGGRRWAKFAKYFAQQNVNCHVIYAHNYSKTESLWTEDVLSENIHLYPTKFRFQYLLGLNSKSLIYRAASKLLRFFINFTKYSPHFSTSLSRKLLIKRSIEIIKANKINTVIVSGDPYMYLYASQLKELVNIKVVLDYRDLWNDHPYWLSDQFHKLTTKQRAFFEYAENKALEKCDEVVCVYDIIATFLKKRSNKDSSHIHVIPNGFDSDEYKNIHPKLNNERPITLFFAGNSHSSASQTSHLLSFVNAYHGLLNTNKELWSSFKIQLLGNFTPEAEKEIVALNDYNISLTNGYIKKSDYLDTLASVPYALMPMPDEYKDALFITKAFDYFYLHKPVIYIGAKGLMSDFVETNQIGFSFNSYDGVDPELFFGKLIQSRNKIQYSKEVSAFIESNYNIRSLSERFIHSFI